MTDETTRWPLINKPFRQGNPPTIGDALRPDENYTSADETSGWPGTVRDRTSLRFASAAQGDAVIAALADTVEFYVEPFDYQTARLTIDFGETANTQFLEDMDLSTYEIQIEIVRSSFGKPATPNDGQVILSVPYTAEHFITAPEVENTGKYIHITDVGARNDVASDWKRQRPGEGAVYDQGLTGGRWYYYTLFVYAVTQNEIGYVQEWKPFNYTQVLIPRDYGHRARLYDFLPPYYQYKDSEFAFGTGKSPVLQRYLSVIAFDLDYTRTLAEGIEQIYDMDQANQTLVEALGIQNFGYDQEGGLGDIRYRSMVASLNRLYRERGTGRATQQMARVSSQYATYNSMGVNIMRLPDDSEMGNGMGGWAMVTDQNLLQKITADSAYPSEGGFDITDVTTLPLLEHVSGPSALDVASTSPPSRRNKAVKVRVEELGEYLTDPDGVLLTDHIGEILLSPEVTGRVDYLDGLNENLAFFVACGLGTSYRYNRYHEVEDIPMNPYQNGIRVDPGKSYTFSAYILSESYPLKDPVPEIGDPYLYEATNLYAGVILFRTPENRNEPGLSIVDDYLTIFEGSAVLEDRAGYAVDGAKRVSVNFRAPAQPWPRTGEKLWAVPYIMFGNAVVNRYISCAMFNEYLNLAQKLEINADLYIILNDPNPDDVLNSGYKLGSP